MDELLKQLQGSFPAGCSGELEQMERLFCFEQFDSGTALNLGNQIISEAAKYHEDLAVRIIRLEDQIPVFQYIGSGKSQRNIDFAMKKANTVLKTGHCSLWALAKELIDGGLSHVFRDDSGCLPVGGAFPIFVDGTMKAVVAVSGLHNGLDHQVVVDAVCKIKHAEVPAFSGVLV